MAEHAWAFADLGRRSAREGVKDQYEALLPYIADEHPGLKHCLMADIDNVYVEEDPAAA